jgi:hypothetical protein
MPGAYAHLTLANRLREPAKLDSITGLSDEAKLAIMTHFCFCELGAVSPDYPYLAIADSDAAKWADEMHYTRTGEVIHAGIRRLQAMGEGVAKDKCLAWLLGYSSHFAADVTIHPVVFLKVGDYADHKSEHRTCEMNQDAIIFPTLNLGDIGLSEFLDSSIALCGNSADRECLDPDVKTFWAGILQDVYPDEYAANPPDIDKWHHRFIEVVDGISNASEHLVPFARHVGLHMDGMMYPTPEEAAESDFIKNLETPDGVKNYDAIFDYAVKNTARIWGVVAQGVYANSTEYQTAIGNWDLDTGKDNNGNFGLWG